MAARQTGFHCGVFLPPHTSERTTFRALIIRLSHTFPRCCLALAIQWLSPMKRTICWQRDPLIRLARPGTGVGNTGAPSSQRPVVRIASGAITPPLYIPLWPSPFLLQGSRTTHRPCPHPFQS
eukprot:GGOE01053442.1.p3 GENE.GGOE01053442.1~~GGOE01053442.1.p3  ORF type:complete len:143 (-),score=6.90 GGOE01053442.1:673-1041(-)